MFVKIFVIFLTVSMTSVFAAVPISPGGSNYAWYKIDALTQPAPPGPNCRESYGIIKNYHATGVRSMVQSQLQSMNSAGQERLRIPIFFMRGAQGGTLLDSSGGNFSLQVRDNLEDFLSDIKSSGFREIEVGFFPQANNSPLNWSAWNESYFQENWNLIFRLHPLIAGAGIHYKIDLGNEFAPASSQSQWHKNYVKKMWINYNLRFGKADTVGFSVASGANGVTDGSLAVDRYNTTKNIYESTLYGSPYVWEFHFYEYLEEKLEDVDAAMTSRGDNSSIIIGETYYNDSASWYDIMSASISRTLWHVFQWPLSASEGCDGHVDVSPPVQFQYY
ncbi:hypothetical protein [Gilvimarinus agarilyticus]|uniref:hypothetical protein n=1 Tax=Gilvimarinus agarilyticus TaxID=679259 RepID=UPI0012F9A548|nr:hypothetical protein [Gilvimarinus agarilyticus]